jgi:hypothetical protein
VLMSGVDTINNNQLFCYKSVKKTLQSFFILCWVKTI